jgi:DNA-binding MarR family transcriptional regulator
MTAESTPSGGPLELGISNDGPFVLDPNLLVTGRTCVLGSSGSGKSYAVGVICEELCKKNVPFALIDTEGEHSGLKEKFEVIWVGDDDACDLKWDSISLEDLASQAPDIAPLILDTSELQNAKEKVGVLVSALYREISRRRTPYLLVLEEADKFIPQSGQRVQIFDEIARRGRKRGLGLILCSQRPSLVDKNVLSQCGNQLIGKLVIQNDLRSVSQFFPGRGPPSQLTSLRAGSFYAVGGFSPSPLLVTMRKREARHGGVTPTLKTRVVKPFMGTLGTPVQVAVLAADHGSSLASTRETPESRPGLSALIQVDDVPYFVKREKQFKIFGEEETVASVQRVFYPLVEVGARLRKGLIKKRYETKYFTIDGRKGKLASSGIHLTFREGLERLLGLSAFQVELLVRTKPGGETGIVDLSSRLGETKGTVRRALKALEERNLVRSVAVRRTRVYRRLMDLPRIGWRDRELEAEAVDVRGASLLDVMVSEKELREVIRGMYDGSDLDTFRILLYPLFKVELILKRKRREVFLDGRSGREIPRLRLR